jgi:4'-phosphopantetheinyl transferase
MQKAGRLLDPRKKVNSLACRALLRETLGAYLGIRPDKLHFAAGAHGKPYLAAESANNAPLHFNLSHSGSLFLLAIAADREIGIDVEQLRDETHYPEIARLAFSQREQEELFRLPEHQQRIAFYRCWTRKEACLKASGAGFSIPSNSFDVNVLPDAPATLTSPNSLSRWILRDISVPEDYCAALAVKGSHPIISYID